MPRVLFIFLFITTSLLAEMNWAEDYKSGLKEAAQKQKKVIDMVNIYSYSEYIFLNRIYILQLSPSLEMKNG